jgi:hypothetical protein
MIGEPSKASYLIIYRTLLKTLNEERMLHMNLLLLLVLKFRHTHLLAGLDLHLAYVLFWT